MGITVCVFFFFFFSFAGFKFSIRAISEATADPVAPKRGGEEQSSENWKIKMLYDGECPLCMREVHTYIYMCLVFRVW